MNFDINMVYPYDCLNFTKDLPDKIFNLIVVDPPYFILDEKWDKQWNNLEEYLNWFEECMREFSRVLRDDGSIYIYCSEWYQAEIDIMLRKYFHILNRIDWYYEGGRQKKKCYSYNKEPLFYCVKDENNYTFNLDDIRVPSKYAEKDKRLNPLGKNCGNVWYIPNLVGKKLESTGHKTQKPLEICNRIIKASSNEHDIVYIPFAGSGSEIESCIINNRDWVATEINEDFIKEYIIPRIDKRESTL
jgi:DNA modification methylase